MSDLLPLETGIPIPYNSSRTYYRFETIEIGTSRFYPEKLSQNAAQSKTKWQKDNPPFSHWRFEIHPWKQEMIINGQKKEVKGCRVWRLDDAEDRGSADTNSAIDIDGDDNESEEVPEPKRGDSRIDVNSTLRKHSNPQTGH